MDYLEALKWRVATKEFSDKEVPQEDIDYLMEAARLAPSSFNTQPWHIVIIRDPELLKAVLPAAYNQTQVQTTKCLFVFCANTHMQSAIDNVIADMREQGTYSQGYETSVRKAYEHLSPDQQSEFAQRQTYIALGMLLSAAAMRKIDAGPMEGLDRAEMAKVLKLPKHILPLCNVAIGYRKESPKRPKVRLSKERVFDLR